MKHTIEFLLPDDSDDLDLALYAPNMSLALEDMYQLLRSQAKHADPPMTIHEIKDEFHRILEERGVRLFE